MSIYKFHALLSGWKSPRDSKRDWVKRNPELVRNQAIRYRQKHRREYDEYQRGWRNRHPKYISNYNKNNPKKMLEYNLKYLNKISESLTINPKTIDWAQRIWASSVKLRDKHICQICGRPAVHAHHIFYKNKQPKLMFNINNGIALCQPHHYEIHKYNKTH